MRKQIGETLSATKTQNTLTLMQFLMQPEVYDARWSEFAVSDSAAILIRAGVDDLE